MSKYLSDEELTRYGFRSDVRNETLMAAELCEWRAAGRGKIAADDADDPVAKMLSDERLRRLVEATRG